MRVSRDSRLRARVVSGGAGEDFGALLALQHFEEARSLLRRTVPLVRRVYGESHEITFKMRKVYARSLCSDPDATLDDLREAVTTLEDAGRIARRVLGGTHPTTTGIETTALRQARDALHNREPK